MRTKTSKIETTVSMERVPWAVWWVYLRQARSSLLIYQMWAAEMVSIRSSSTTKSLIQSLLFMSRKTWPHRTQMARPLTPRRPQQLTKRGQDPSHKTGATHAAIGTKGDDLIRCVTFISPQGAARGKEPGPRSYQRWRPAVDNQSWQALIRTCLWTLIVTFLRAPRCRAGLERAESSISSQGIAFHLHNIPLSRASRSVRTWLTTWS